MKIKETIYTEVDERGRVIATTRTVSIDDSYVDRGYDYAMLFNGGYGRVRETSFDRIFEAYNDYRKSQQW